MQEQKPNNPFGCVTQNRSRSKWIKSKRQTAIEKRRNSRRFKQKRFELHKSRLKVWRQGLKARRAAREAREAQRAEMEIALPLYENSRKRRAKTALDCSLGTCPKKMRMLAKVRRLEGTTDDESDGNVSIVTRLSSLSPRTRSPIRVARRH